MDKEVFKRSVRNLKGLRLTDSLDTGYRRSPKGKACLAVGSETRE